MSSWHSYPSIFNVGHKALDKANFWSHTMLVQEKVDGSQFSFGVFDDEGNGELTLKCKSKGAMIYPEAPPAMFRSAVETVIALRDRLVVGWTYRGEVLCKPKHNALAYDRVPVGNIILFDINRGEEDYLYRDDVAEEARRLGLEVAPILYYGRVDNVEDLRGLLNTTSILGGQLIEGVVIKPLMYDCYGVDKKVVFAKYVSEKFREVHRESWKGDNPSTGDVLERIIKMFGTVARWNKAIQHLRDDGQLTESPKDIGLLIQAVQQDVGQECKDEIMHLLWKAFWKDHIMRGVTRGLPEWYKAELAERQLGRELGDPAVQTVEPAAPYQSVADYLQGHDPCVGAAFMHGDEEGSLLSST